MAEGARGSSIAMKLVGVILLIIGLLSLYVGFTSANVGVPHTYIVYSFGLSLLLLSVFILLAKFEE